MQKKSEQLAGCFAEVIFALIVVLLTLFIIGFGVAIYLALKNWG